MTAAFCTQPLPGVPYAPEVPVFGGAADDELMLRFWAYEAALMGNDVAAMEELFADDPGTLRGDAAGLLVGHDRISAFRGNRGGAPRRTVREVHRRDLAPDAALLIAITRPAKGGRGQQTQVWQRSGGIWRVTAAHVAIPAAPLDTRIWRLVGDPLVPTNPAVPDDGSGELPHLADEAPLAGRTVAVKDLFAVAGQRIGAGSPAWLEEAEAEPAHAAAVEALLDAGAQVKGIARTDEFAYSLAGTNTHYGTPPNPEAPYRISGGSSSGSASAVSSGHADIGLGTDTGGSIRVPSAYQGLWGLRTTHGMISREGLLPLAQSFDTVGWMTRGPELLTEVTRVMAARALDEAYSGPVEAAAAGPLVVFDGMLALADDDVAVAVREAAREAGAIEETGVRPEEAQTLRKVLQAVQAGEAWANHGAWVSQHWDRLAPDVSGRFQAASERRADELREAGARAKALKQHLRELIGDRVVVIPSASSVAPMSTEAAAGGPVIEAARAATMALTSLAGLAGLPAVSVPLATEAGLPAGMCLIGPPGSDLALVRRAASIRG
ncbi:AtzH-like domain-containing protein [Kocuria coralli]|nr:AtzH-like domain-containing protein [Kocuria coralli]